MGIEDSNPISTGVAPSFSKKLVSNTPLVVALKIAARMPSSVDAWRLVRRASLEIFCGVVGTIGAGVRRGCCISKPGEDKEDSTGLKSSVYISK